MRIDFSCFLIAAHCPTKLLPRNYDSFAAVPHTKGVQDPKETKATGGFAMDCTGKDCDVVFPSRTQGTLECARTYIWTSFECNLTL